MAIVVPSLPCLGPLLKEYSKYNPKGPDFKSDPATMSFPSSNPAHGLPNPDFEKYLVSHTERHRYGIRGLLVLASSHPADPACIFPLESVSYERLTYTSASKKQLPYYGQPLTSIYEDSLGEEIQNAILAVLPDCRFTLCLHRLGFHHDDISNPPTFQVRVCDREDLSDNEACEIVANICSILPKNISTEPHVDVCKVERNSDLDCGISVYDSNPDVYDTIARRPYSSVGPKGIDSCGTLGLYVEHNINGAKETYALTNRHVVDPDNTLSCSSTSTSYIYEVGFPKRIVNSPTASDHESTIRVMKTRYNRGQGVKVEDIRKAEEYNIELGYVYAASKQYGVPPFKGTIDWALIQVNDPDMVKNEHVCDSSNFLSFKISRKDEALLFKKLGVAENWVNEAYAYFKPGPYLKSNHSEQGFRTDDISKALIFKPRSRTSGDEWAVGIFNGTRNIKHDRGISTKEHCVFALDGKGVMSAPGDSGSIFLDKDFNCKGMMWGGGSFGLANGPVDFTYITPLEEILRDIEKTMNWDTGSVSLLGPSSLVG